MLIDMYKNQLRQVERDLIKANSDLAASAKKEANENSNIARIRKSITKNTSISTLNSKSREIDSHTREIERQKTKQAELQKKIASLTEKKIDLERKIAQESSKENKRMSDEVAALKSFNSKLLDKLASDEEERERALYEKSEEVVSLARDYDIFISHASEDKEEIAEPLSKLLTAHNISNFYDQDSIAWGDSIPSRIDEGILRSKVCLLIISPNFIAKQWTKIEKDAFMMFDDKKIYPIWHKVSKAEVQNFSPTLAAIKAIKTADYTLEEIAQMIADSFHK